MIVREQTLRYIPFKIIFFAYIKSTLNIITHLNIVREDNLINKYGRRRGYFFE